MNDYNSKKEFLGTGWSFPVTVDKISGRVQTSSYEKNIEESIQCILQTQRGERVMQPDFGCNLKSYSFSELNYTVMTQVSQDVHNALVMWEPRITDIEVNCRADNSNGALLIDIAYTVRSTNNPYNMVFPFYLNENA